MKKKFSLGIALLLGVSVLAAGCGEEKQRAAEGAQNMSDHAVHSLMGMRCPEMLSINYLVLFQIILKVK